MPPKPTRPTTIYRRGKPITTTTQQDSDHSSEEDEQQQPKQQQQNTSSLTLISIQSTSLHHDKPQSPVPASAAEEDQDDESDEDDSSDDDDDEDDDEEDEEEEEEEEEKLVPIYKPVFTAKQNRKTVAVLDRPELEDPDLQAKKIEEELQRRKLSSRNLVEQTLVRELAEKQVGEVFPDVDDTDGLDPEAEFECWKLRELRRLQRDRDALIERAKEKEELEARRALPESQRLKEDLEFAEQTRKSKSKTKQVFLQKYHHKGAFYNDAEILKKHDYTAPTEGTFTKMDLLPSVMQVRDFGKMSRSKWTHLAKEDTTSKDAGWSKKPGAAGKPGCFQCGEVGHMKKDCPQTAGGGGHGANGVAMGVRRPPEARGRKREDNSEQRYPSKRREAPVDGPARDASRDRPREPTRAHDSPDRARRPDDRYPARDHDSYDRRDRPRSTDRRAPSPDTRPRYRDRSPPRDRHRRGRD